MLDEAEDPVTRARLLGPYAEIVVACNDDVESARTAADELTALAAADSVQTDHVDC